MKKIAINVVSFVMIVMVMAVMSRITIKTERYDNVYWRGDGWCHAKLTVRETKLVSGELIDETVYEDVQWAQKLGQFLSDRSREGTKIVDISFR